MDLQNDGSVETFMMSLIPCDTTTKVSALLLVLLSMWYFLFLGLGDGARLLGYVNAGGSWFGAASIAAAALAAQRRAWLLSAAGSTLAVLILAQGHALPMPLEKPSRNPSFRVVTASLRNLNNDMADAARVLLALNPDILVVQEADIEPLFKSISATGGEWDHVSNKNEAIACRCQILKSGVSNGILWADVFYSGQPTVRIWDIRAPKSYRDTIQNRFYFTNLAEMLRSSRPAIAAGDFNSTPWNDGYRTVSKVAHDSWRMTAWGPGFTFPTATRRLGLLFPLVRIDHIFMTQGLVPLHAHLGKASSGADHMPIAVDFYIEESPSR